MKCKSCGEEVGKGIGEGFCVKCYNLDLEKRKSAICLGCGEFRPIRARGYCRKCYNRVQRLGTTELPKRKKVASSLCTFCGKNVVHAKGLCGNCYNRWIRTGSAKYKKPEDYVFDFGVRECVACGKTFQPVRKSQKHCSRKCYDRNTRRKSPVVKVCKNPDCLKEFTTTNELKVFCSTECRVKHFNSAKATRDKEKRKCDVCGSEFITDTYHGKFCSKECQQKSDPVKDAKRKHHIKAKYKLTQEDYEQILKEQDGVCAICGNVEEISLNGVVKNMAVDHDHTTGEIRGLLCQRCNQGLGHFQDDVDRLEKAIDYLKIHAPSGA